MNASASWEAPIGNIAIKYRHVDKFDWKDGIWSGVIGPYDLIDIHYNYQINKHLEFNIKVVMTGIAHPGMQTMILMEYLK